MYIYIYLYIFLGKTMYNLDPAELTHKFASLSAIDSGHWSVRH